VYTTPASLDLVPQTGKWAEEWDLVRATHKQDLGRDTKFMFSFTSTKDHILLSFLERIEEFSARNNNASGCRHRLSCAVPGCSAHVTQKCPPNESAQCSQVRVLLKCTIPQVATQRQHSTAPLRSKLARNNKKAAMHDRKDGLNNIEEDYLMQQEQRSDLVREAEKHHNQQQLPSTGKMILHYFLAGIGVTIGFLIIGVAMRAVGLEHDADGVHAAASAVETSSNAASLGQQVSADGEDDSQRA